jgi:hypothetical protein
VWPRAADVVDDGPVGDDAQPWQYGGRYYLLSSFIDVAEQGGFGWELEDVGPAPTRGVVLEAFRAGDGEFTFTAYTDRPLPFGLVHRFVTEAGREIGSRN